MIVDLSGNIQMINSLGCSVPVNSIDDIMIFAGCLKEWKTVMEKIGKYQFYSNGHTMNSVEVIGTRNKHAKASKLSAVGDGERGGFSFA